MADEQYTKWIDAVYQKKQNVLTNDLYLLLVGTGHTSDRSGTGHEFLSSISGGDRIGSAVQIPTSGRTFSAGALVLPGPVNYAATSVIAQAYVIYSNTDDAGSAASADTARRLMYWNDGKTPVVVDAQAASGATSIIVEPLEGPIPSGTTFTLGGVSVTTSGAASAGARAISVTATGSIISAGSTGEASKGQGWPAPASPGGIQISFGSSIYTVFQ